MKSYIQRVEIALQALRNGRMVLLTDDSSRENEADFIFPAECMTHEIMNFMIRQGSGIICLSLTGSHIKKLGLSQMVPPSDNHSRHGTPFTISIEARTGISTGVSAKDRTTTILAAVSDTATESDLVKPGHVFPLHAKEGGCLERAGHTEGALDLVKMAGFKPAAVLCEVMNPDGTMSSGEALHQFAQSHELPLVSIQDLIEYRRLTENLISEEVSTELPTEVHGTFKLISFKEKNKSNEQVALIKETRDLTQPLLVRIHSSCMTGDLFGSLRCDCNQQLHYSLDRIQKEGGILIYLDQEGRGIGIFNKIQAYQLQTQGFDTIEANQKLGLPVDARTYYLAANFLKNRQIRQVRLLTNNPLKKAELEKYGIEKVIQVSMPIFSNPHNLNYLKTKKEKLDHDIHF